MSFTNDPVQPPEGQGGDSQDAPYSEYLNRIPEELRSQVEPVFKEWDSNTTRRFQEASEFKKQWEPFQETGIHQYSPDEVAWLGQFRQALDDPQAIAEWYQEYASQNGLVEEPSEESGSLEDFQYEDPGVASMLEKQLGPIQQQLQEFANWQQQLQQNASVHQRQEEIDQTLSELEKKHPDDYNYEMIDKFVSNHFDKNPREAVEAAFRDWQSILHSVQKDTLTGKLGMPPAPEHGGSADGSAPEVKTMKEAGDIAKQWLRGNRTFQQ